MWKDSTSGWKVSLTGTLPPETELTLLPLELAVSSGLLAQEQVSFCESSSKGKCLLSEEISPNRSKTVMKVLKL